MTNPEQKTFLIALMIVVVGIVGAVGLKLCWDDYQIRRAQAQGPVIVKLLDQIRPFPGATQVPSDYEGPTANEYAASVWRYYQADAPCEEIQRHLDAEAVQNGFARASVEHQNSGVQVYHRRGEYEMRIVFEPQNSVACDFAVSVNWTAFDLLD
jgi:hypothetical protein